MRLPTINILARVAPACVVLAASAPLAHASSSAAAPSSSSAPAGRAAPARLVGLYAARFGPGDEQTSGTWHLRVGPDHHLKVWNTSDRVARTPSFEAGPVSFRGDRMVFARVTAKGVCRVGATYAWTLHDKLLRFTLIGKDGCEPRVITFTPHAWRRSS